MIKALARCADLPAVQVWTAVSGWTASRRRRARGYDKEHCDNGPRLETDTSTASRRTAGTCSAYHVPVTEQSTSQRFFIVLKLLMAEA